MKKEEIVEEKRKPQLREDDVISCRCGCMFLKSRKQAEECE